MLYDKELDVTAVTALGPHDERIPNPQGLPLQVAPGASWRPRRR